MNCSRFQQLLFEYADGSLPPATLSAAEQHLARCSSCEQALQKHQQFGQALSEGFRRETAVVALGSQEQRRIIATVQDSGITVPATHALSEWWPRIAWIGATAAVLLTGFFLVTELSFLSPPGRPDARLSTHGVSDTPMMMRFSYCEPSYTFQRQADLVIDSLSCTPRVIEQTLWLAQQQKLPKSATKTLYEE